MKVQSIQTVSGERYLLINNQNKVVPEVKQFLKYLDNLKYKRTTQQSYCFHLKLYYDFLDETKLEFQEIFDDKKNKQGPLEYLSSFMTWLMYPKKFKKIDVINGEDAVRTNKTVNLIMNTVLRFYDFHSRNNCLEGLDVYKKLKANSRFKSFLSELHKQTIYNSHSILKLREINKKPCFITRSQFNILYKAATCIRNKAILAILFESGLRVSELIGLHVCDIDFSRNEITIRYRDDVNNQDSHVKNMSEGSVYVPDYVMICIHDYLIELLDISGAENDVLFVSTNEVSLGKPLTRNNIEQMVRRTARRAGLKELCIHPHTLRHSFAIEKIQSEIYQLSDLQKLLRHKNIQTSMQYIEFTNDFKMKKIQNFCEQLDLAFSPEGTTLSEIGTGLL